MGGWGGCGIFLWRIVRRPRSTRADTVCPDTALFRAGGMEGRRRGGRVYAVGEVDRLRVGLTAGKEVTRIVAQIQGFGDLIQELLRERRQVDRSEEHTSELQSLMRISYAVFCLKKTIQQP